MGKVLVTRAPRYGRGWELTFRRLQPRPHERTAIAATIGRLRRDSLPMFLDREIFRPPVVMSWERSVPGTSLIIVYDFDDEQRTLTLLALVRSGE